jgi:hypothetical protein
MSTTLSAYLAKGREFLHGCLLGSLGRETTMSMP